MLAKDFIESMHIRKAKKHYLEHMVTEPFTLDFCKYFLLLSFTNSTSFNTMEKGYIEGNPGIDSIIFFHTPVYYTSQMCYTETNVGQSKLAKQRPLLYFPVPKVRIVNL